MPAFRVVVALFRVIEALPVPVISPLTAIEPKGDWIFTGALNVLGSMAIAPLPSERPIVI